MKSYTIDKMFSDARPCEEWSRSRVADLMAKHGVESVTALDVLTCDDVNDADKIWQACRMITPEQAAEFAVFCAYAADASADAAAAVDASADAAAAASASADADAANVAAAACAFDADADADSLCRADLAAAAAAHAVDADVLSRGADDFGPARTRQIKYLVAILEAV